MLLLTSVNPALCQQTTNSSQTDSSRRARLVESLERTQAEVKAGRLYIDSLKEQVRSKQSLIDEMKKRDDARIAVQNSLQNEVTELQAAIEAQKKALKIKEQEIDYLKKELSRTQKKLKNSHTREKILTVTTVVLLFFLLKR